MEFNRTEHCPSASIPWFVLPEPANDRKSFSIEASARWCQCLTHKYQTRPEVRDSNEHPSLLMQTKCNYHKKFKSIELLGSLNGSSLTEGGRLCTIDLLVLTSLDELILI